MTERKVFGKHIARSFESAVQEMPLVGETMTIKCESNVAAIEAAMTSFINDLRTNCFVLDIVDPSNDPSH